MIKDADKPLIRACSRLVNVSMSFCTARVPCVFSATATRSPDAAAVFSNCSRDGVMVSAV